MKLDAPVRMKGKRMDWQMENLGEKETVCDLSYCRADTLQ
jgi:hypothetical protein